MPRFDFQCPHCQYREEYWVALQAVDLLEDSGVPRCRMCGLGPMRKLFSAVPAIFRGGGWASKS